jgi:hypothetical protein
MQRHYEPQTKQVGQTPTDDRGRDSTECLAAFPVFPTINAVLLKTACDPFVGAAAGCDLLTLLLGDLELPKIKIKGSSERGPNLRQLLRGSHYSPRT